MKKIDKDDLIFKAKDGMYYHYKLIKTRGKIYQYKTIPSQISEKDFKKLQVKKSFEDKKQKVIFYVVKE